MTDTTDSQKQRQTAGLRPFKPGQSGNPSGKPRGSRNRLQGDFMRRLAEDFERYGIYAIARTRRDDPATYLRVCASLMPKEVELTRPLDDISDEQLDAAYVAVTAILAARDTAEDTRDGDSQAGIVQPAQELPTVPEAG